MKSYDKMAERERDTHTHTHTHSQTETDRERNTTKYAMTSMTSRMFRIKPSYLFRERNAPLGQNSHSVARKEDNR